MVTFLPLRSGKVEMTIDGNYMMQNLQEIKDRLKDVKPINWDIVTVPVDPQNPDFSNTVSVSNVFGINAQSPNTREAWEFIKNISTAMNSLESCPNLRAA